MQFHSEVLSDKLEELSKEKKIVFGASCCERLLPNYKKFVEVEKWGDFESLRSALNEIWKHVVESKMPQQKISGLIDKCDKITPDAEDFSSIYTSFAIDAGGAIYELLQYCLDGKTKYLVDIASFARDTVDMYIQERDDMDYNLPDFEEQIVNDELMQKELKKQFDDLEVLKNQKIFDESFIHTFRSSIEGKSNIEL